MLSCRELTHLIASDGLADAPWTTRLGARLHLFMCDVCSAYVAQLRAIGQAARELAQTTHRGEAETLARLERDLLARVDARGDSENPSDS